MKLLVFAQIISKFAMLAWQDNEISDADFEYMNKILPSWLERHGISYDVRGVGNTTAFLTPEQAKEFVEFCKAIIRTKGAQIWDDGVVDREDYKNLSTELEQTFIDYFGGEPMTITVTKTFNFVKEEV